MPPDSGSKSVFNSCRVLPYILRFGPEVAEQLTTPLQPQTGIKKWPFKALHVAGATKRNLAP